MAADEPIRARGTRVSADFFEILGVKPVSDARLRAMSSLISRRAASSSSVSALWRQQFAGDPRIVGRTIQINGNPATIIGVMPAAVRLPDGGDTFLDAVANESRQPVDAQQSLPASGRRA